MRLLQIALIVLIGFAISVNYQDSIAASSGTKSSKSGSRQGHKSHGRSKGKKSKSKAASGDVWDRIRYGLKIPIPEPSPYGSEQLAQLPQSAALNRINQTTTEQSGNSASNEKTGRLTSVIIPKKPSNNGEPISSEKSRMRQVLMPRKNSKGELAGSTDPDSHYTPLGRLKLTSKEPKNSLLRRKLKNTDNNIAQTDSAKKSGLFKSASVQRIRTRLGLHPELYKNPDNKELVVTDQMSGTSIGKNNVNTENSQLVIKGCADFNKSTVITLVRKRFLSARYMQFAEECRIRQNAAYARIDRQVNGYGRDYLQRVAERARPFLFHVVDSLSKYNLPMDLALLPIVESAYQPTALSSAQAAGIWQFIPSTGREFGLQQTEDYDARLDVVAETHAAVRFLSGLRDHYRGDWLLALAAYNAGPGTVDAAISRNVAAGLESDYWSLDLPAETQDYVPRLLALARIFSNPSTYGLKLRPIVNETYFIKVHIDHETDIKHLANKDLRTVAKLADFNPDQFSTLNSAYLKATLPEFKSFSLLMPISNANLLHQSLAFMAQSHKDEGKSTLHFFEELALFSEPNWTTPQTPLLAINLNEQQQWSSPEGQAMTISVKPDSAGNVAKTAKVAGADYLAAHYLDKGESLKAVAENHGVSEEALRETNKLKRRQTISLGHRLLIPLKQLAANSATKKTNVSVLFKGMTGDFDLPHPRL